MVSLRDRQADLARVAMIEALVRRLESGDETCSVEEVAQDAGVSRRTLYRYFPSREDLYAAAADALFARMGQEPPEVSDAGDIAASFIAASRVTEQHPALSRALLRAPAGRGVRTANRKRRTDSILEAVARAAPSLPETEVRRRAAVVALLCNSQAFITLQDEVGLNPDDSRAAIVAAIEVLMEDLWVRAGRVRRPISAGKEAQR
ncbi:MAG: hypothetical protein NVS9B1_07330 [Candidatus Dormibacteraceae bacterium]